MGCSGRCAQLSCRHMSFNIAILLTGKNLSSPLEWLCTDAYGSRSWSRWGRQTVSGVWGLTQGRISGKLANFPFKTLIWSYSPPGGGVVSVQASSYTADFWACSAELVAFSRRVLGLWFVETCYFCHKEFWWFLQQKTGVPTIFFWNGRLLLLGSSGSCRNQLG